MLKVYEPRYIAYLGTSGSKRERLRNEMRIIFTDKLSKIVAYYENLRDMI